MEVKKRDAEYELHSPTHRKLNSESDQSTNGGGSNTAPLHNPKRRRSSGLKSRHIARAMEREKEWRNQMLNQSKNEILMNDKYSKSKVQPNHLSTLSPPTSSSTHTLLPVSPPSSTSQSAHPTPTFTPLVNSREKSNSNDRQHESALDNSGVHSSGSSSHHHHSHSQSQQLLYTTPHLHSSDITSSPFSTTSSLHESVYDSCIPDYSSGNSDLDAITYHPYATHSNTNGSERSASEVEMELERAWKEREKEWVDRREKEKERRSIGREQMHVVNEHNKSR